MQYFYVIQMKAITPNQLLRRCSHNVVCCYCLKTFLLDRPCGVSVPAVLSVDHPGSYHNILLPGRHPGSLEICQVNKLLNISCPWLTSFCAEMFRVSLGSAESEQTPEPELLFDVIISYCIRTERFLSGQYSSFYLIRLSFCILIYCFSLSTPSDSHADSARHVGHADRPSRHVDTIVSHTRDKESMNLTTLNIPAADNLKLCSCKQFR